MERFGMFETKRGACYQKDVRDGRTMSNTHAVLRHG
jgi:hypothetical protein